MKSGTMAGNLNKSRGLGPINSPIVIPMCTCKSSLEQIVYWSQLVFIMCVYNVIIIVIIIIEYLKCYILLGGFWREVVLLFKLLCLYYIYIN